MESLRSELGFTARLHHKTNKDSEKRGEDKLEKEVQGSGMALEVSVVDSASRRCRGLGRSDICHCPALPPRRHFLLLISILEKQK